MIKLFPIYNQILLEKANVYTNEMIATMAWLYILYVYANTGMELSKWDTDKRMGISFSDVLPYLIKHNYAKQVDKYIKLGSNKDYIENILLNYFMVDPNNSLNYYKNFNFFNKYSVKYPINKIPFELYTEILYKNSDYTKNVGVEIEKIKKWFLDEYQNDNHKWRTWFNKYLGSIGQLIADKKYKLFRGIYVNASAYPDLKEGDEFTSTGMSWTLSFHTAKEFSFNNNGTQSKTKIINKEKLGIVLYGMFNQNEVLLDATYIQDKDDWFHGEMKFGNEYEVIVSPKPKKVKIFKIYKADD